MNKFLAVAGIGILGLALAGFGAAPTPAPAAATEVLDPLRGDDLDKHLVGPEVTPGSLKGKVVLFEYWGFG